MPLHPTEGLFLTPLSGVTEALFTPGSGREIETARSLHLTGQGGHKKEILIFFLKYGFQEMPPWENESERKQKREFLIICLLLF